LALPAQQPAIATPYPGRCVANVRRLLLGRIRYFIYYRATPNTLDVLAVWHVSRGRRPSL